MQCFNITTNISGIPYLSTTNTTVTDTAVDFALGFRNTRGPYAVQPVGYFTVRIADAIPADTTGTLPVTLTLNGISRALTFFNGTPVTAADLTGTGIITVFNDRFNGILQMTSAVAA
jgi:hypothetical protein